MAPASSTLAADEAAIDGRGGNGTGERFGLRAKAAAGVAILGCAAALTFGGLLTGGAARHQPQAGPAAAMAQASGIDRQRFLAANRELPDGTLPGAANAHAAQRFLEWNTQLPTGGATGPLGIAQQRFLELNTQLPSEGAPALIPPGPATFPGEKH
jgi:hypothetical protein